MPEAARSDPLVRGHRRRRAVPARLRTPSRPRRSSASASSTTRNTSTSIPKRRSTAISAASSPRGWHTVIVGHRKMVDALFADDERIASAARSPGVSGPSPGVNKMEFKAPVRPGDTVTYTLIVTEQAPLQLDPRLGPAVQRPRRHQPARRARLSRRARRASPSCATTACRCGCALAMALTRVPGLGRLLAAKDQAHDPSAACFAAASRRRRRRPPLRRSRRSRATGPAAPTSTAPRPAS